jgi:hypothetical protein
MPIPKFIQMTGFTQYPMDPTLAYFAGTDRKTGRAVRFRAFHLASIRAHARGCWRTYVVFRNEDPLHAQVYLEELQQERLPSGKRYYFARIEDEVEARALIDFVRSFVIANFTTPQVRNLLEKDILDYLGLDKEMLERTLLHTPEAITLNTDVAPPGTTTEEEAERLKKKS